MPGHVVRWAEGSRGESQQRAPRQRDPTHFHAKPSPSLPASPLLAPTALGLLLWGPTTWESGMRRRWPAARPCTPSPPSSSCSYQPQWRRASLQHRPGGRRDVLVTTRIHLPLPMAPATHKHWGALDWVPSPRRAPALSCGKTSPLILPPMELCTVSRGATPSRSPSKMSAWLCPPPRTRFMRPAFPRFRWVRQRNRVARSRRAMSDHLQPRCNTTPTRHCSVYGSGDLCPSGLLIQLPIDSAPKIADHHSLINVAADW